MKHYYNLKYSHIFFKCNLFLCWQKELLMHTGSFWATHKQRERLDFPKNELLQIVIKHLKWSLFVGFQRGASFLCSLLVLSGIWSPCIKTLSSTSARSWYIYAELKYLSIHVNIICNIIRERLGNCWGKRVMCNIILDRSMHYSRS